MNNSASISAKKELRGQMREARGKFSKLEILQHSAAVCRNLLDFAPLKSAKTVLCYLSTSNEVDLVPIMRYLQKNGYQVVVPVCSNQPVGVMRAAYYEEDAPLVEVQFGLREPQNQTFAEPQAIDVVLVPGLAFDCVGHRLGVGGGYYDRFLPQLRQDACFVGICHDCQLVDGLEVEEHDVLMNFICSESGIVDCLQHRQ